MAVVETEEHGQVLVVRLNRPERLNAMNRELRQEMARIWTDFRTSAEFEVGILTGTGRGFCAGEDMKESLADGEPGGGEIELHDPFMSLELEKPVIAAVNGFAMGGGFMLVERTDLRVASTNAVFEVSEVKRWLLGGCDHGAIANMPYPVAMEMALGYRFTAQRFYELGFVNRLVEPDELMPTALEMARQVRPGLTARQQELAKALHLHGALSDRMESRAAFAEKRAPVWKGWDDPGDRYRMPTMADIPG